MNTLFIGGGNMGRALIGGLLKKGFDPNLYPLLRPTLKLQHILPMTSPFMFYRL